MNESMSLVDRLAPAVGWDGQAPEPVDPAETEAAYGCALPSDLHAYIARFPPGDIGILYAFHPLTYPEPDLRRLAYQRQIADLHHTLSLRAEDGDGFPFRFGTRPGELLVWGMVQADHVLCLEVTPGPPDSWHVVVCDTGMEDGLWARFGGGVVAFLLAMAEGRAPVPMIEYVRTASVPFVFRTYAAAVPAD